MRRLGSALIAVPLAVAVACGSNAGKPNATPSSTTSATPAPVATSIAYASYTQPPDIFVYDVKTDAVRALTSDGAKTREHLPRFRSEGVVSYVTGGDATGDSLMQISTDPGAKPSLIFHPKNVSIVAYDWSPDGNTIAYLTRNARDNGGATISTYRVADGAITVLKRLPNVVGRGISEDDAFTVAWSPDGANILAVHTALATGTTEAPSMYVLHADGSDAATPLFGTQALWSRDGAAVYYRELSGQHRWLRLSVSDGKQTPLAITGSAVRPSLSPDGKTLAYDIRVADSPEGVPITIAVLDLASGKESRIISGFVRPVWLNSTAFAASKIRACQGDECADGPNWTLDGDASRTTLTGTAGKLKGGGTQELKLGNTIDSDAYYR